MPYNPNNPYIPGDPYSYDLEWIVAQVKSWTGKYDSVEEAIEALNTDFSGLKDYVDTFIDSLDIQAAINNKLEDMYASGELEQLIENIIDEKDSEEIIETYFEHAATSPYETSHIVLKIPRSLYNISFHHSSGNDNESPNTASTGNALTLLADNLDKYEITHNFNLFGDDYAWRYNGAENAGTNTNYRLFGFDSVAQEWTVSASGALIGTMPQNYDTVLKVGGLLLENGAIQAGLDNAAPATRAAFGSDDDYWYILYSEGRGIFERGLTLLDMATILYNLGCQDAINIDGGGSVCLAVNDNYNAIKVNKFRDQSLPYPELRATAMCACFEKR